MSTNDQEESKVLEVAARFLAQEKTQEQIEIEIGGAKFFPNEDGGIWRVFCWRVEDDEEILLGIPAGMTIVVNRKLEVICVH
ncbi:MAG: hypothetical protein AAF483_29790 [Planctomycetota bacterium]